MIFNKEQSIGYWAKHIITGFKSELEKRVEHLELSAPECFLILIVSEHRSQTLVEIARILEHTHPSVIRHLDGLELAGYLKRTPHPEDRRKKMIQLTDKGNHMAPLVKEELSKINEQAMNGFSQEETDQVLASMKRITSNLGCHPDLCACNCHCPKDDHPKGGSADES
jgi:MarR family transcriptional regulator, transcriptional regulator for hemolysin